jgi:hypothetical protein
VRANWRCVPVKAKSLLIVSGFAAVVTAPTLVLSSVPPLITKVPAKLPKAALLLMFSVPLFMFTPPVNVFVPLSVTVPLPTLLTDTTPVPLLAMVELMTSAAEAA